MTLFDFAGPCLSGGGGTAAAFDCGCVLWVGGGGIRRVADIAGVKRLVTLDDAAAALADLRGGQL